jgi:hypothetical protein
VPGPGRVPLQAPGEESRPQPQQQLACKTFDQMAGELKA